MNKDITVNEGDILVVKFKNFDEHLTIKIESIFWDVLFFNAKCINIETGNFFYRTPKYIYKEIDVKLTTQLQMLNTLIDG